MLIQPQKDTIYAEITDSFFFFYLTSGYEANSFNFLTLFFIVAKGPKQMSSMFIHVLSFWNLQLPVAGRCSDGWI